MNRKLFSNKVIFLLIAVLGMAYVYLNLPNNINIQKGGAYGVPVPPECIPLTYKFRYLIYFGMVFAIVFAIAMGLSVSKISSMTYSDYIKKGLDQFASDTIKLQNKTLKVTDPDGKVYTDLIKSCSGLNQNAEYAGSLCKLVAPCTCCNEKGYYHKDCPPGSEGAKIPVKSG
jgi:hypothetical protein